MCVCVCLSVSLGWGIPWLVFGVLYQSFRSVIMNTISCPLEVGHIFTLWPHVCSLPFRPIRSFLCRLMNISFVILALIVDSYSASVGIERTNIHVLLT